MFERLPGFRDFYPEECARRNHVFRVWTQAARVHGFTEYDIPTLEPLELFTEKSGEEIVGQLFNFTDKGGREVALRPELTPSLARMVGSRANSLKRPVKWFNIAENFRYEKPQKGRLRSHYQFNADIFGEPGAGADAELIAVCLAALRGFGLTEEDMVLRLSDRNLWMDYLAALGHEGEAALGILGVIDKLERLDREATLEKLRPFFHDAAEDFLANVETLVSLRDLDELTRFLRAQAPNAELRERIEARLAEWRILASALEGMGLMPFIRIDLGIVRGLAYYTGFVFEVFEKSAEGEQTVGRALAGGGRYDHLVAKLGYPEMPACGFGMGDVTLTDLLDEKGLFPQYVDAPDVFAVIGGEAEREAALSLIAQLRGTGIRVDYPLKNQGFGKQFKQAGSSGARLAMIIGSEELEKREVKVRNLASGDETSVPMGGLVGMVHSFLHGGIED